MAGGDAEAQRAVTALREGNLLTCVGIHGYPSLPTSSEPRLVLFTGNKEGDALASWCPDCQRAVPAVLSVALEQKLKIVVVGVGERDDWKLDARGASNPARAADGLALTGVPTLLLLDAAGREKKRLGSQLEDAADAAEVRSHVLQAISESGLAATPSAGSAAQHYFFNGAPVDPPSGSAAADAFDGAALRAVLEASRGRCVRLFVAGAVTHVGKTTVCLSLLSALRRSGVAASELAYIKPATQCEAPDLLEKWCGDEGVEYVAGEKAPLVFYSGFTRSFLDGEQGTSASWLDRISQRVDELSAKRRVVVVDGVGFPAVGSIVGVDNADVARACRAPVLIVCKSGVGSAIDSFNLNSTYFLAKGVPVLGAVFNMGAVDGFYSSDKCAESIKKWFASNASRRERYYGVIPIAKELDGLRERVSEASDGQLSQLAKLNSSHFARHADIAGIIGDAAADAWNRRAGDVAPAPVSSAAAELGSVSSAPKAAFQPKSREQVAKAASAAGAKGGG
eukprot:TRINITY_DN63590_c0_g1_i1.p1 TRINITY_DN63590_c0_g1~~TRINITY_DN63590_c0_g1_i1.p1  ORF type:complete len:547 (-),score=126.48 TRINITY_DN63590_c0_g1_i1:69-1595(-)